jgi:hypothetical protein
MRKNCLALPFLGHPVGREISQSGAPDFLRHNQSLSPLFTYDHMSGA